MSYQQQLDSGRSPGGRRRARLVSIALFGFAVFFAVTGFAGAARPTAAARSGALPELRFGYNFYPVSLNPALDGYARGVVTTLAYEPIIHLTASGSYSPGLATTWHYVKESTRSGLANKLFEFTLRHNARFSDGSPVDAAAVVTWFNYFYSAKGQEYTLLGPNPKFRAMNKWTVRITMEVPNTTVPFILSNWGNWGLVASPSAVANPSTMSNATFGAGPYVLDAANTITGATYTYIPNNYYYDKSKVHFSKVVASIIAQPTSMLAAMQSGQIDAAAGDPTTVAAAQAAGFKVVAAPGFFTGLVLGDRGGVTSAAIGNLKVRQAINYAIDRKSITRALLGNWGEPTSELVSTDGWLPSLQNYYPYEPAKAKSLLAQAGYPNGFTLNIVDLNNGVNGDPMVQAVAQNLNAIGIHTVIRTAATTAEQATLLATKQYPAHAQSGGINPYANFFSAWFLPAGPANPFNYNDPVLDRLYFAAARSTDPSKYYDQVTERIVKQAYLAPVWENDALWYVKSNIGGIAFTAANHFPWAADWYPVK